MRNTLIVITGPTAVGKTGLCLDIAERHGMPIINADSRQIYRDMSIGTAKPTAEELQRVRHYFVNTLSLDDYYSASIYEQEVMDLLPRLFAENNGRALLTGGSMMYIDAVCNGIDDIPTIRDDIRQTMKERLEREGLEALVEELRTLDPEHYDIVDRKNTRRVVHALEICHQTGKTYTSFRKKQTRQRPFDIVKIALTRNREELYNRITARVDKMMEQGLEDEARRLLPKRELNALNTVGYKEMFEYFDGNWALEEAVERLKGNTRRYARKQLTWFKRDESVKWFTLDEDNRKLHNFIDDIITNGKYEQD